MTKVEKIIHGESTEVLKGLDDNSVDSVVCDPPYGLSKEPDITKVLSEWVNGDDSFVPDGKGFMSKEWDGFVPPPSLWREVYRVLKPGGHALVFSGTRTQDLMTISLRLAGFEVRDVIEWLYFSGFPKSHDVGKAFDKRNGRNYPDDDFRAYLKERAKSVGLTGAQVDRELGTNGMWGHYTGRSQPAFPTVDAWQRMTPLLNIDNRYDEIIYRAEAEREKVGEKPWTNSANHFIPGKDHTERINMDITAPATELARKWGGWGTSLKPSHEPIIVVRKPLIDADTGRKLTVADCVEKYGTGAINIDASRVTLRNEKPPTGSGNRNGTGNTYVMKDYVSSNGGNITPEQGRFPANCITLDDDAFYSKYFNVSPEELSKKASKKDRNSDWQGEEIALEAVETESITVGSLYCVDCDVILGGSKRAECQSKGHSLEERKHVKKPIANSHPTVKPTDLMAWLVRLVTPEGGTVLDPFAGSGSTLVAAKRNGFSFVGVELTEEYIPIIEARTGIKAEGRSNA